MKNYAPVQLRNCLIFLFFAVLPVSGGCVGGKLNVEVVLLNYTSKAIAEVTIQGEYIGGYYQEYGPGGTGGGIYCCIDVKPGSAIIQWEYDRPRGTSVPPEGFVRKVSVLIPEPKVGYKFLGVHIYPDERVEFTLTQDMPSEKKQGVL